MVRKIDPFALKPEIRNGDHILKDYIMTQHSGYGSLLTALGALLCQGSLKK